MMNGLLLISIDLATAHNVAGYEPVTFAKDGEE